MTDTLLPGILGEIEEVAGLAVALQIAAAKGGATAYFPSVERLTEDHWLIGAVGWEAAETLCRHFGGRANPQLKIPLGPAGSRGKLWAAIRKGLAQGKSAAEIARALGVDEKTVRRHRTGKSGKGRPADSRQGSFL